MQDLFARTERVLCTFVTALTAIFLVVLLQQSLFLTTQDTVSIDTLTTKGFYTADVLLPAHIVLFLVLAILAVLVAGSSDAHRARWQRWGCLQQRPLFFLAALFWLPAGLYVTFVYGTLPALALSMAQLWCFARWCTKPAWSWCVLGALCGAAAAMLKQNYLVFSIAWCLYYLWLTLRALFLPGSGGVRRAVLSLTAALLVPVFYMATAQGSAAVLYAGSGLTPGEGKAASAWLLVGMQDLSASEGWVNTDNAEVDKYFAEHGREATDAYCRERIAERLAEFRADPAMALRFYACKTTSQWNMPTFQALATNHNRPFRPGSVHWAQKLLAVGDRFNALLLAAFDLLLTQLWAWSLIWLLLRRGRSSPEELLFAVVFAGGFVLQLVWEAKARNTLIYAFILLPCAVQGWCALGTAIRAGAAAAPGKKQHALWPVLPVVALLLLSGVSGQYISCDRAEAAAQLTAYRQWQAEQTPDLPRGACLIRQAQSGQTLVKGPGDENALLCTAADQQSVFTLLPLHDYLLLDGVPQTNACQILFAPENTLGVGMSSYEGSFFVTPKPDPDPFAWVQQWHLHPQGGGLWTLCILDTGGQYLALTDIGNGTLDFAPETGDPGQCWLIEPIAPAV